MSLFEKHLHSSKRQIGVVLSFPPSSSSSYFGKLSHQQKERERSGFVAVYITSSVMARTRLEGMSAWMAAGAPPAARGAEYRIPRTEKKKKIRISFSLWLSVRYKRGFRRAGRYTRYITRNFSAKKLTTFTLCNLSRNIKKHCYLWFNALKSMLDGYFPLDCVDQPILFLSLDPFEIRTSFCPGRKKTVAMFQKTEKWTWLFLTNLHWIYV